MSGSNSQRSGRHLASNRPPVAAKGSVGERAFPKASRRFPSAHGANAEEALSPGIVAYRSPCPSRFTDRVLRNKFIAYPANSRVAMLLRGAEVYLRHKQARVSALPLALVHLREVVLFSLASSHARLAAPQHRPSVLTCKDLRAPFTLPALTKGTEAEPEPKGTLRWVLRRLRIFVPKLPVRSLGTIKIEP